MIETKFLNLVHQIINFSSGKNRGLELERLEASGLTAEVPGYKFLLSTKHNISSTIVVTQ
jgi:hypothetical protein